MGATSLAVSSVRSRRILSCLGVLSLPLTLAVIAGCGSPPPPEAPAPVAAPPPPPPPPPPPASSEPVTEQKPATPPAPPPAPDLQKCTEMVEAPDGLIDDAEDGDDKTKLPGMWSIGADDKGSKFDEPKMPVTMVKGGADKSKMAFHAKGKTASGEGAWGVNMGPELQGFDASKFAGISFWAKVGPKSVTDVRFNVMDVATVPQGNVCTQACWNHFGKDVKLTAQWKKITVAFTDLAQLEGWGDPHPPHIDASKIYGVKWSVPPGKDFDIWLDQITFLKCK